MTRKIATNTTVDRESLLRFVRPRHRVVLLTTVDLPDALVPARLAEA